MFQLVLRKTFNIGTSRVKSEGGTCVIYQKLRHVAVNYKLEWPLLEITYLMYNMDKLYEIQSRL